MAKIASKGKRVADVALMLEKGLERNQILQKFSRICKVSDRTVDGYIKEAKIILSSRNEAKEAIRTSTTAVEYKQALNEAIISDLELETMLCEIARKASPMEQIAAIDKIWKKRGSYAPIKQANTDTEGTTMPQHQNIIQQIIIQPIMSIEQLPNEPE